MPVNAVSLCHSFSFKMSFISPDLLVKIKMGLYTCIYQSEMSAPIKVKVINAIKGQFGQQSK